MKHRKRVYSLLMALSLALSLLPMGFSAEGNPEEPTQAGVLLDLQVPSGRIVTLDAGQDTLDLQWQVRRNEASGWENLLGACSRLLSFPADPSCDAYQYRCLLSGDGPVWSDIYRLNIFSPYSGGTGSPDDPYLISTPDDLLFLSQDVASGYSYAGEFFLQTDDLDLAGMDWIPIGQREAGPDPSRLPFSGSYDGQNYEIQNLSITGGGVSAFGQPFPDTALFGYIEGGFFDGNLPVLKNIRLVSPSIQGTSRAGALVGTGYLLDILDCSAVNARVSGGSGVGGLCGVLRPRLLLDSFSSGKITADGSDSMAGGLIGALTDRADLFSTQSGHFQVPAAIARCGSEAEVFAPGFAVGGLAGAIDFSQAPATLEDCFAVGNVTGGSCTGGFAGVLGGVTDGLASRTALSRCYASGTVLGQDRVGGILGFLGSGVEEQTLSNVFSLSPVIRAEEDRPDYSTVGRIFGEWPGTDASASSLSGVFALSAAQIVSGVLPSGPFEDTGSSNRSDGRDGFPKSASDLRRSETWEDAGFDLSSVWRWEDALSGPVLQTCPTPSSLWTEEENFRHPPGNQSIPLGEPAFFFALFANPEAAFQWQARTPPGNWADLSGETGPGLRLDAVTMEQNGLEVRCRALLPGGGWIDSGSAQLAVEPAVLSRQPEDCAVFSTGTASFSVAAEGRDLRYQWQQLTDYGWADISGADSPDYSLETALSDSGLQFRCAVSLGNAVVYSRSARLTVWACSPRIETAEDLALLSSRVSQAGDTSVVSAVQTADIDLSGLDWVPIGSADRPFQGAYSGGGYRISNLKVSGDLPAAGLFGAVQNGRLSGIVLQDPDVRSISALPDAGAGALAGRAGGGTSIYQCCAFGGSVESGASAGGLVGLLQGANTLEQCWTRLSVSAAGNGQAGGLAGGGVSDSAGSRIQNCYAAGAVTAGPGGSAAAGGLVGRLYAGEVSLCFSAGTVTALPPADGGDQGSEAGGIGMVDGTVSNCAALLSSLRFGPDALYARVSPSGLVSGSIAWSGTELRQNGAMVFLTDEADCHGQDKTRDSLRLKDTWANLGYDFTSVWDWQAEGYPTLKHAAPLRQDDPFPISLFITAHPAPLTAATVGKPVTLSTCAQGEALTFQWQKSDSASGAWADIANANEPSFKINRAAAVNSGFYRCIVVSGGSGETEVSQAARLVVRTNSTPAYLTAQPMDAKVVSGDRALFAAAAGPNPVAYQWQVSPDGGVSWGNLDGAAASTLLTGPVTVEDASLLYRCQVSNKNGGEFSEPVRAIIVEAYEENPLQNLTLRRAAPWLPSAGPGEKAENYLFRPGEAAADVRLRHMTAYVWSDSAVSLTATPIPGWRVALGGPQESSGGPLMISLSEGDNLIPITLTALDNPQRSVSYQLCIRYVPQLALSHVSALGGVVAGAENNASYVLNPLTDRSGGRQLTVISGPEVQGLALRLQVGAGSAIAFREVSVTAGDDGLVTLPLGILPEEAVPFFQSGAPVNLGTLRITHPLAGTASNDYRVALAGRPLFADASVVSYVPAPGPEVNHTGWGTDWDYLPLLTGAGRDLQSTLNGPGITLGSYGGSVTLRFHSPVRDDPAHPYGIDFKVYGNHFAGDLPEPGVIQVAQDKNGNGQPEEDEWFTIAGSEYYNYGTIRDYRRTYYDPSPGQLAGVPWTDSLGNRGMVPPAGSRPVFPDTGVYGPAVWMGTDAFEGKICPVFPVRGMVSGTELGQAQGLWTQALFGYCDAALNPALPKFGGDGEGMAYRTQLASPYAGPGEGCGVDIAWAVDAAGKPAGLEQIDFVRVYTASPEEGSSTEVTGISRMEVGAAPLPLSPAPRSFALNGDPLPDDGWEELGYGAYFRAIELRGLSNSIEISIESEETDIITINNACFSGGGTYATSVYPDGSRMVRVIVQRGSQPPRIYVLACSGGGSTEDGTELAGIALRPGDLTGGSTGDVWSFTVPHNTERVSLTASPLSPGATLFLGAGGQTVLPPGTPSAPFPVAVGETRIPLTVRSADGTSAQTYTILITRLGEDPQPPDGMTVYFSLFGDGKHAPGLHAPESWISETSVIVPAGTNIRYLTDLMLHNSTRDFLLSSGRLHEVSGLAAGAQGPLSRWVFRCNGRLVDQLPETRVLQPGDRVEWSYTDDYTQEKDREDSWNEPSAPGNSDSAGSGMEQDREQPAAPIILKPAAANLAEAIQTAASGDGRVVLKLPAAQEGAEVQLALCPEVLALFVAESSVWLTVKTPYADITFPAHTLSNLSTQALGGIVLTAGRRHGDKITVVLTDKSGVDVRIPGGFAAAFPVERTSPALVPVLVDSTGAETILAKSLAAEGTVTALLTGTSVIRLAERPVGFSDVAKDRWSADSVTFAAAHGLFQGDGGGGFSPEATMSRAMLTTVLWRLEGRPDSGTAAFPDVPPDSWYAGASAWAEHSGIVSGDGTGFAPDQPVTREQMAVMLYRYAGILGIAAKSASGTQDLNTGEPPSPWAAEAVAWTRSQGLMTGRTEREYAPKGLITREETATVLERFILLLMRSSI